MASAGGCAFDVSNLDPEGAVVGPNTELSQVCPLSCGTCDLNVTAGRGALLPKACYTSSTNNPAAGAGSSSPVYFIPQIHAVINGTMEWSPQNWIGQNTEELSHRFTLYMPSTKRLATIEIAMSFDGVGRLTLYSNDGSSPRFDTHEPWNREKNPVDFWVELMFYAVIIWFMLGEVQEIGDCICFTDSILPLQILVGSMELSLLEIQHAHEKTTEVYDPRNPQTGAAFSFPDVEDLENHYNEEIVTREAKLEALNEQLDKVKLKVAQEDKGLSGDRYDALQQEMTDIQMKLMVTDWDLNKEVEVAETASAIQLSVMWLNKWSMDFPDNYLSELSGSATLHVGGLSGFTEPEQEGRYCKELGQFFARFGRVLTVDVRVADEERRSEGKTSWALVSFETSDAAKAALEGTAAAAKEEGRGLGEEMLVRNFDKKTAARSTGSMRRKSEHHSKRQDDGLEAYCQVNWIEVSRAYIKWKKGEEDDSQMPVPSQSLGVELPSKQDVTNQQFQPSKIFASQSKHISEAKKGAPCREKHFANLVTFVDYLQMLREVLTLHTNLVTARGIKHWNGVRIPGEEMSNTVGNAFQGIISRYNKVGKTLQSQMRGFPDEILDGFHEPNPMRADTLAIRARAVQQNLEMDIATAGLLGLFFPGSGMWELRRYLRRQGLFTKSESFWTSITPSIGTSQWGVVSAASMTLYLQADDIELPATTPKAAPGDEFGNPLSDDKREGTDAKADAVFEVDAPKRATRPAGDGPDIALKGWRNLVTFHTRNLVNMDGQFILDPSSGAAVRFAKSSFLFPLFLWVKCGLKTYISDVWNLFEFFSYVCFLLACYCRVRMALMAGAFGTEDEIGAQLEAVLRGELAHVDLLPDFQWYNDVYMWTLMPNGLLMWIKLFKFVDVIPQMAVLIKVLAKAVGPVLIFMLTAMIPCVGLALSYHTKFGATLKHYSTVGASLNTLMRMMVGDFDFEEIHDADPLCPRPTPCVSCACCPLTVSAERRRQDPLLDQHAAAGVRAGEHLRRHHPQRLRRDLQARPGLLRRLALHLHGPDPGIEDDQRRNHRGRRRGRGRGRGAPRRPERAFCSP